MRYLYCFSGPNSIVNAIVSEFPTDGVDNSMGEMDIRSHFLKLDRVGCAQC
jgi:hypothetical protein